MEALRFVVLVLLWFPRIYLIIYLLGPKMSSSQLASHVKRVDCTTHCKCCYKGSPIGIALHNLKLKVLAFTILKGTGTPNTGYSYEHQIPGMAPPPSTAYWRPKHLLVLLIKFSISMASMADIRSPHKGLPKFTQVLYWPHFADQSSFASLIQRLCTSTLKPP